MTTAKQFMKEWVMPILIAIALAFLINRYLVFKIQVPSPSMVPAIQVGDNIFVTRIYNYNNIKRGDVIVFYSQELKLTLVKRAIGLPGDTVEVRPDATVWVNNKQIEEPYVQSIAQKFGVFKVPEGKYLFFGDNRAVSLDARYWKEPYISTKDIKGKAQLTVYPFNRIGFLK